MCGGIPNSGTGTPHPRQTFWQAVKIILFGEKK
jgi:hypothetical protein